MDEAAMMSVMSLGMSGAWMTVAMMLSRMSLRYLRKLGAWMTAAKMLSRM